MTNEQPHHEHAQDAFIDALFEQSPINIAALLRACADGELNPEQCERLQRLLRERPESETQHEFEQRLRECCGRAMGKARCPDALRDRVAAMAAGSGGEGGDDTPHAPRVQAEPVADRIERSNASTRKQSFWSRSPMLGIAAAALVAISGVLIWQSTMLRIPSPITTMEQAGYTERVGSFVLSEHTRCCSDDDAEQKLIRHDVREAIEYFSDRFQRPVHLPDMSQEDRRIKFFGGGDCHVPQTEVSGHLRFDAYDDDGNAIALSLFIAPDPGILPLREGITYQVRSEACDQAGARLFIWISDGVQYVLVSEAPDDTCASVRSILNAPRKVRSI